MHNCRPLWGTASLLLGLWITACGGHGTFALHRASPALAQPALSRLGSPAEVLRCSSQVIYSPFANGSQYAQASAGAYPRDDTAQLIPGPGISASDPVYAVYHFHLPGFSGPSRIGIQSDLTYSNGTPWVWIGLANWQTGRWQWFPAPARGELVLPSLAPYFNHDGTLLLAWVGVRDQWVQVDWVRVGDGSWFVEEVPFGSCFIDCKPDRTPVVAGVGNNGRLELWEHSPAGWTNQYLGSPTPANWSIKGMALDDAGQGHLLVYGSTQPDPDVKEYYREQLLFPGPTDAGLRLEDYVYVPPPGPGSPPDSDGFKSPPVQPNLLAWNTSGFAAAYSRDSEWHTAVGTEQAWTIAAVPYSTYDLTFTDNGALRGVEIGAVGGNTQLTHLVYNGSSWDSEVVSADLNAGSRAWLLQSGSTWQILTADDWHDPRLYSQHAGDWTLEELRPTVQSFERYEFLKVAYAEGVLRLADRKRIFTRTGWGTMEAKRIEVPQFNAWGAAFDSAGKLHAIGWQGSYDLPEDGHLVYVREP